jgi:recombinational DNA repair protein (RecF pathway)
LVLERGLTSAVLGDVLMSNRGDLRILRVFTTVLLRPWYLFNSAAAAAAASSIAILIRKVLVEATALEHLLEYCNQILAAD